MTQQIVVLEGRQDQEDRVERARPRKSTAAAANSQRAMHFMSIIRPKRHARATKMAKHHLAPDD